ncbi:hypothetical protein [Leptolyngbya subtilissima]
MLQLLLKAFFLIWDVWNRIPKKTREKIIDTIVSLFDDFFREYYKASKQ